MRVLSECLRYADAARLRDRIASLERVAGQLARLERCLLAPAVLPDRVEALFVAGGRVAARGLLSPDDAAAEQLGAGLAAARAAACDGRSCEPDYADELLVVGRFVRRPPPELRVLPLDLAAIRASLGTWPTP